MTRQVLQAILEKFEFFPIKCRVQRALELFKDTCKRREKIIDNAPMKQKVEASQQQSTIVCKTHVKF